MKKNKWDIIGSDIDKSNDMEYIDWFYYWYDGDYFDYGYGEDYLYDYTDTVYQDYIHRRGKIHVSLSKMNMGSYIDMMSIYPKYRLRQIKIDYLLGEDKWEIVKKPTFKDLYEKRRNI
jgi:hypothetical protein